MIRGVTSLSGKVCEGIVWNCGPKTFLPSLCIAETSWCMHNFELLCRRNWPVNYRQVQKWPLHEYVKHLSFRKVIDIYQCTKSPYYYMGHIILVHIICSIFNKAQIILKIKIQTYFWNFLKYTSHAHFDWSTWKSLNEIWPDWIGLIFEPRH